MSEYRINAGDVLAWEGIRARIVEFGARRDSVDLPSLVHPMLGPWKAFCEVSLILEPFKQEIEMSNQLKVGDVVRLNSGGPDMTVAIVRPNAKEVFCTWIGEGGITPCAEFKSACLTLVRAAPEQPRAATSQTPLEKAAEEYRLARAAQKDFEDRKKEKTDEAYALQIQADNAQRDVWKTEEKLKAISSGKRRQLVIVGEPNDNEEIEVWVVGDGFKAGDEIEHAAPTRRKILAAKPIETV